MGAKGKSKYGDVGDVKHSPHGDFIIEYITDHKNIGIRFLNTGYQQVISLHTLKSGRVEDRTIYTQEFRIARLTEKRPEYDFSEFVYMGSHAKSTVKCPEHGAWEVSYEKIMMGRGCPKCRGYNKTTEEVVAALKEIHGDTYDFSNVNYTGSKDKVEVVCRKHGPWFATVKTLLKGHGCKKCSTEGNTEKKRKTTLQFVEDAKKVHGTKYDYSNAQYTSCHEKVSIRCIKHNYTFEQEPASHLYGAGCPLCGREALAKAQSVPVEEFITRAKQVHGDRYSYDLVDYSQEWPKVSILCKEHGVFTQSIHSHLLGSNCPVCRYNQMGYKLSGGFEYYKGMMEDSLGDTYEVLPFNGDKCTRDTIVDVKCLCCGKTISRNVESFLKAAGCECQRSFGGFSSDVEGYVYVMESNRFVKVGVSRNIDLRAKQISQNTGETFKAVHKEFASGKDCLFVEKEAHKRLKALGYSSPVEKFTGSTECFFDVDPEFVSSIVSGLMKERRKVHAQ